MASHIACHTSDMLPNSFPPPRPAEREYRNFMASEYQASSLMDKSNPKEKYMDSKDAYVFEDDFPVLSKPAPTVTSLCQRSVCDPQLHLTPEKHVSPRYKKNKYMPDPDLTITPEKSSPGRVSYIDPDDSITQLKQMTGSQRTVRFDQNVEVLQMSPESSTLGTSPGQSETSLAATFESSRNIPGEPSSLNLDERLESDRLAGGKDVNYYYNDSARKTPSNSDPRQQNSRSVDVVFTASKLRPHSTGSKAVHTTGFQSSQSGSSSGDSSGLDSFSSTEPESVETIDIIASDLQPNIGSRSKRSKGGLAFGEGIVENNFARPEFSSTLRVRKEMTDLKDSEVDLVKAVKQKLKTSGKTNSKLKEKAYSRVNRGDDMVYRELPGIEVQNQDAVLLVEEQITSRVKPTPKTQYRAENQLEKAPDIMEFFERKFQRETASFSLPGQPGLSSEPQTASLNRAFDVYTHIRGWEDW